MVFKGNLYKVLNVPDFASTSEVRQSFRILVLRLHPDKKSGSPSEKDPTVWPWTLHEVIDAYKVLNVEESKKRYDEAMRRTQARMNASQVPRSGIQSSGAKTHPIRTEDVGMVPRMCYSDFLRKRNGKGGGIGKSDPRSNTSKISCSHTVRIAQRNKELSRRLGRVRHKSFEEHANMFAKQQRDATLLRSVCLSERRRAKQKLETNLRNIELDSARLRARGQAMLDLLASLSLKETLPSVTNEVA